jgi:hypothetical protein
MQADAPSPPRRMLPVGLESNRDGGCGGQAYRRGEEERVTRYVLQVEEIHVGFQRAAIDHGDNDWLTVAVRVDDVPPVVKSGRVGGVIHSGDVIKLGPDWAVGLPEVSDSSIVMATIVIVNLGDEDSFADQERTATQIGSTVGQVLQTVGFFMEHGGLPQVGVVLEGIGQVVGAVASVAQTLGDLFAAPKCNGPVYTTLVQYTGQRLSELTAGGAVHRMSEPSGGPLPESGSRCGHQPETDVLFSIALAPPPPPDPDHADPGLIQDQRSPGVSGDVSQVNRPKKVPHAQ